MKEEVFFPSWQLALFLSCCLDVFISVGLLEHIIDEGVPVILPQGEQLLEYVDRQTIEREEPLNEEVNLPHVSHPLLIIITEGLVHHLPDLLSQLKILVSQDVGELDDGLSIVTHELAEVLLPSISSHSHLGCEKEAEESIHHGDSRESCTVPANEPSTLVVVVLASIGDMRKHPLLQLVGESID